MNKPGKILVVLIALTSVCLTTIAQKNTVAKSSAEIVPNNSTHIARITKDSITVITSSTYSFTVDTHPDSGLVSINTSVKQLLSQIQSRDGFVQKYSVINKDGSSKDKGDLLNGDRLIVTSQDGKANKTYNIVVQPMAVGSQLRLEKKRTYCKCNIRFDSLFHCRAKNTKCHG